MGGTAKCLPPPNKKYANVKARLDTGCNELKIKGSETKANARFHRGENFRRLKVHTLHLAATAADCSSHCHTSSMLRIMHLVAQLTELLRLHILGTTSEFIFNLYV